MREREVVMEVDRIERRMTQEASDTRATLSRSESTLRREMAGLSTEVAGLKAQMRASETELRQAVQDIAHRQRLRDDRDESRKRTADFRNDVIWMFAMSFVNVIVLVGLIAIMLRLGR